MADLGEGEVWRFLLIFLALLLCSSRSFAQNPFTLNLVFVSDPGGASLAGSGTSSASLNFGTVRAFGGTVPSGVTKSVGASSWTLNTTIDVSVTKGGLDILDVFSTSYTLTAGLQATDLQNIWKWNSITLSTATSTITTSGVYGSTPAYSFSLTIPFSAAAGAISNTINLTAVAN
jgi:hypothetical protein